MYRDEVLNIDWTVPSVVVAVIADPISALLPVLGSGASPKRVLLTAADGNFISFSLSEGTIALGSAADGVFFVASQGYLIVNSAGMDTINTFGIGVTKLHVTALTE